MSDLGTERGRSADSGDAAPQVGRRVAMKEVAERAGVALSSVSRVLSDHPQVSAVMRHRVLDAVAVLGYERDLVAQTLRSGSSLAIGFVAGDISNPLISGIAEGAEIALQTRGYSMVLTNSGNDPGMDAARIGLLRQRRVDGLIASVADESNEATREAFAAAHTPIALVDRAITGIQASAVLSAHADGIAAAVEHLHSLGHQHVALVNGPGSVRPGRERANSLRRTCKSLGMQGTVRTGAFSAAHGESAALSLLGSQPRPTALISGSNQILVGVLRAIRQLDLRIPDDVSLITCDDVPLAEFLSPPLATISREPRDLGRVAAELLMEQISSGAIGVQQLPTHFRPAASCAPPPSRHSG